MPMCALCSAISASAPTADARIIRTPAPADERIPGLRLAVGLDEIAFKHESNVYGVYELLVT
jgi:hypothetical protein